MKLHIPVPHDKTVHEYCLDCQAETIVRLVKNEKRFFKCTTCGHINTRSLYFDNRKSWLDDDSQLWHESVGIFVKDADDRFLFFERTTLTPFGLTIPAGHIDYGETADKAARRELVEETGLQNTKLTLIGTDPIPGDSCSAGADDHLWSVYLATVTSDTDVTIEEEEGANPVWLTLEEALYTPLVFATRHLVNNYANRLQKRNKNETILRTTSKNDRTTRQA